MIETRLLYYFLAVAREQNITKAAEVLHITQPSLSKQMNELEYLIGKKLLNRGNKKTTLTDDGLYFRSKAEEIITLIEKTELTFMENDTITGQICFGCAETNHMNFFTKIFKEIHNEYNAITFNIQSGDAIDIMEKLDKGIIDIALMIEPEYLNKYNYLELPFNEVFGVIMKKDHPLANNDYIKIEDLKDYPLFISNQESHTKYIKEWNKEKLNIIGKYNLIYNATYLVENDIGLVIGIDGLINRLNNNLIFKPFIYPIKSKLFIVTKKYQHHSPAIKLLIDSIKEKTGSI